MQVNNESPHVVKEIMKTTNFSTLKRQSDLVIHLLKTVVNQSQNDGEDEEEKINVM